MVMSCHSIVQKDPNSNAADAVARSADTPRIQQNSVGIEVYTLRISSNQTDFVKKLWQETDEQALPPSLRRELIAQGFRAGVIGNFTPAALAYLLQSPGKIETTQSDNGSFREIPVADLMKESAGTRQFRNILPDMRAWILPFEAPLPEYALFWNDNGFFTGATLQNAVGILTIQAVAEKDGSATLTIVPELEYGYSQLKYRPQAGIVVSEMQRPRKKFEMLSLSQKLLPGQWFIVGASSMDSPGAGRAFFFREEGVLEQRLIAIRLLKAVQ
ncbi:hypothetical protein FACS189419_05880 [Planctomycetales bacterium]|nr:hypothetical protein FACS189419_05880 [Planctomycetales bacterium]